MDHAAAFSASKFFSSPKPTSRLLRPFYNADSVVVPTRKPFNPFEEAAYHARQLNETVAAFVARLPPSTTSTEAVGGWIWIANPHAALRETDADVSGVREEGGKILGRLRAKLDEIEVTMSTKGQAARTRAQNKARAESQGALLAMAKKRSVRTGKWMLFPSKADVDRVWRAVAEGTAEGRLGCSAKVAADEGAGERAERVVCVYTEDFSDIDDVKRVLMELATLGQVQSCGPMGQTRGIYFKPGEHKATPVLICSAHACRCLHAPRYWKH